MGDFTGVVSLALLAFAVQTIVKFVKLVTNRDVNGIITVASVWGGGCLVSWVASSASVAKAIPIMGTTFGALDGASIVLAGLALGSAAAKLQDWQKARDNGDTAVEPSLIPTSAKKAA